jgi:SpoVK/Ycf46/Vps4 family AAA+-type ATPase
MKTRTPARPALAQDDSSVELPIGVAISKALPDSTFIELWESIVVDPTVKSQLLNYAVLNYTMRARVARSAVPFHGLILLVGEPGTGKTSLARGLAARTAEVVRNLGTFRYLEIDPHALTSSALGKSQRAVTHLFSTTIVEHASAGPTIVLLDEVETLVADRTRMGLEANPIDVHRATDAALVQLDRLAEDHPSLLFVATSNFPRAIDEAFLSRTDLVLEIPLPNQHARLAILSHALSELGAAYPKLKGLASSAAIESVARAADGLDGRTVRKLVAAACAQNQATALDPGGLRVEDLLSAAKATRAARKAARNGAR